MSPSIFLNIKQNNNIYSNLFFKYRCQTIENLLITADDKFLVETHCPSSRGIKRQCPSLPGSAVQFVTPFAEHRLLYDLSYRLNFLKSLKKWSLQCMISSALLSPAITELCLSEICSVLERVVALNRHNKLRKKKNNLFHVALEISQTESTKMGCI